MMTQERLIEIQKKLAKQFMQKVDVYHSENIEDTCCRSWASTSST